MTTHTDRKSAEILAALDKLAENGMPFIDVVKQGGFSGFPAKGVQPLPTEPVQVHEDPGAAYWKEANDFMDSFDKTHTDRIEQMAQEAGFITNDGEVKSEYCDGVWIEDLTRFAQLVAEDCARVADVTTEYGAMDEHGETLAYATAAEIRARYSLKD